MDIQFCRIETLIYETLIYILYIVIYKLKRARALKISIVTEAVEASHIKSLECHGQSQSCDQTYSE